MAISRNTFRSHRMKKYARPGYTLYEWTAGGYGGYGSNGEFRVAPRPATFVHPPSVAGETEAPAFRLAPGVGRSRMDEITAALDSSPVVKEGEKAATEPTSKSNTILGGLLIAAGVVGGGALALKGGSLSTGMKVAAGAASIGVAGGGVALIAKGGRTPEQKKAETNLNRLSGILVSSIPPAFIHADDGQLMSDWESPTDPFYKITGRYYDSVAAELVVASKHMMYHRNVLAGWSPDRTQTLSEWYEANKYFTYTATGETVTRTGDQMVRTATLNGLLGSYADCVAGQGGARIRGLNAIGMSIDPLTGEVLGLALDGIDDMEKIAWVESTTHANDTHGRFSDDLGNRVYQNITRLYNTQEQIICTIRHWRTKKNADYWQLGCVPSMYYSDFSTGVKSRRGPAVQWGVYRDGTDSSHSYADFRRSGSPPRGFYMDTTNPWIGEASAGMAQASMPGMSTPPSTLGDGVASRVTGPMAALVSIFRQLRTASPEVSMLQFDKPEDIFQAVADAAEVEDHHAWWSDPAEFFGTILGVVSYVAEVATPIITAINPALGAMIGTGIGMGLRAGAIVKQVMDSAGNGGVGGILNVLDDALALAPTDLQDYLNAGWAMSRNLYDEVECMVTGWSNSGGFFTPFVGGGDPTSILDQAPAMAYKLMENAVFSSASQLLNTSINLNDKMPYYVNKVIDYTSMKPEKIGQMFPRQDPNVWVNSLPEWTEMGISPHL